MQVDSEELNKSDISDTSTESTSSISIYSICSQDPKWKDKLIREFEAIDRVVLHNKLIDEFRDDIVIAKGLSITEYIDFVGFLEKSNRHFGFLFRYDSGNIIAFEEPSEPHGVLLCRIVEYIDRQNYDLADPIACSSCSRLSYQVNANVWKCLEGDVQLYNKYRPNPPVDPHTEGHYPIVVVEIGVSETYKSMHNAAQAHMRNAETTMVVNVKAVVGSDNIIRQLFCMIHNAHTP
jgi:hypothetical protein